MMEQITLNEAVELTRKAINNRTQILIDTPEKAKEYSRPIGDIVEISEPSAFVAFKLEE